ANSAAWRNRIGKDGQISSNQVAVEKDPARRAGESELVWKVRRAIAQLPAKQGKAIVMRYLEQTDYNAIAQKLKCSKAGARSNVSKALAALKGRLGNE
ncbi:MAG TPA: hypothetical protein ENH43_00920, partial [Phycisphaerales bacterium]|nr:hypothetical protein [Phycisphaerales bacterium]